MPCNVSVRGAFQLTPSARRATSRGASGTGGYIISIHALREEGDCHDVGRVALVVISIHALREEGDELFCSPL